MNERLLFENLKAEKTVNKAMKERSLSHALLFITPDKVLSKSMLLHTAKKLLGSCDGFDNCRSCVMADGNSHPDLFVYPKGDETKVKVEDIEEILSRVYFKPFVSACKVFVINGLENTNEASQNKLLKILEEPPDNTYFLMSAVNSASALLTLRSRASVITIDGLPEEVVAKVIEPDCKSSDEAFAISQSANGLLSNAYEAIEKGVEGRTELAFSVIERLTSTKEMLSAVSLLSKADEKEILPVMALIYRDMLCIKQHAEKCVALKGSIGRERTLADGFSNLALIESIEKVSEAIERSKLNVNKNINSDALAFELLEVKYNCPK